MKKTAVVACALLALCALGTAEERARQASDRQKVQLTVYNQNFALVREQRAIELDKGVNFVRVEDVAAQIDPTSIHFLSLTDPESVVVREQEYQYDLLTMENILNKSVGKRVRLRRATPQGVDIIEGTLLTPATVVVPPSETGGGGMQRLSLAIKTDKGVVLNPQGEWTLDELPAGLLAKPTLLWKLETTRAGKHNGQVSYITDQINWKADYVAVANATDDKVDLNGWVTIDNHSGARYPDATLQLLAGDVRRVQPERYVGRKTYAMAEAAGAPAPQFEEKAFFEYHLYTLAGTTTIEDNSTKQLSLLSAASVPVKKIYIFDPMRRYWFNWFPGQGQPGAGEDTQKGKVNVMLELTNSKENHLGMPLPKGKMRIYKADDKGRLQFVGEDQIDHTPKDEKIRLWVGDAFDIVSERKRTAFERISDRVEEDEYSITLRNHKDAAVEILVVERLAGDWKVLSKTHAFNQKDAHTIEFPVQVPKDGAVTVTYRVRIQW
jgi:hypothetical protein